MEEFLKQVPDYIQLIALLGMAVTVLATIIVRLTPSKIDDEYASKLGSFMMKALAFLPTIGINPRTKALEDAYKELKADQTQP